MMVQSIDKCNNYDSLALSTAPKPANLDKTGVAYSAMVKCLEMFEGDLVKEMEKEKSQK